MLGAGALLAREGREQRRGLAEFNSQNDICLRDSADTSALSTRSCAKYGRGKHEDVADWYSYVYHRLRHQYHLTNYRPNPAGFGGTAVVAIEFTSGTVRPLHRDSSVNPFQHTLGD